jgi:poly-gamma-glutamate capsule biosynthesis protein CapA/YwtB (metallophosphatase superfamily)
VYGASRLFETLVPYRVNWAQACSRSCLLGTGRRDAASVVEPAGDRPTVMDVQINKLIRMAAWSRFPKLRDLALRRIELRRGDFSPKESSLRMVFGGDVMFDPVVRRMWHLGLHRVDVASPRRTIAARVRDKVRRKLARSLLSPDCCSAKRMDRFVELAIRQPERTDTIQLDEFSRHQKPVELDWSSISKDIHFPFRDIAAFFRTKDVVVLNLETPLTSQSRDLGLFKSHPGYARAMTEAGVSVLNLSNNHIFDAGESGFTDTLQYLNEVGLPYVGVGANREAARAGTVLERRGIRFLFLSYTQFCNSRFASLAHGCPGLLPLDRELMLEDVRAGRDKADFVIVSVHWGFENQPNVHPTQVEIAHQLVDAGADAVIGHHPHVPHGIEIYRQRPIVYSLGNFIFAQRCDPAWADNLLVELVIEEQRIRGVIIHPVAGSGTRLFQPALLQGSAAEAVLGLIQLRSLPFATGIVIRDDKGYISLS